MTALSTDVHYFLPVSIEFFFYQLKVLTPKKLSVSEKNAIDKNLFIPESYLQKTTDLKMRRNTLEKSISFRFTNFHA